MTQFNNQFTNLCDSLSWTAKWHPKRTAVICGESSITYEAFNKNINKVANGLIDLGIQKGDKISVFMPDSIETLETIYGVIKAGAVVVPLSSMLQGDVLSTMINDSGSKLLIVGTALYSLVIEPSRDQLLNIINNGFIGHDFNEPGWTSYDEIFKNSSDENPEVEIDPEDDINMIYSSGTTGVPKGIVHTHYARLNFAMGLALNFRVTPFSNFLLTTPLYNDSTWAAFLPTFLTGGTCTIMPSFDPEKFLKWTDQWKCTHTLMVPVQYQIILGQPDFKKYDLGTLELMVSVGASLPIDLKQTIIKSFDAKLLELYGLTEGVATILFPEEMEDKIGSVGKPISLTDICIIDDDGNEVKQDEKGEIVAFAPTIMRHYHNQPEKTKETIWIDGKGRTYLKTGDMGSIDQDGYLYILDRKKDVVNSGGYNIYASDLENILLEHTSIVESAVIAVPHEKWGETPLALVVPAKDTKVTENEIKEFVNSKVAKYQRLSTVEFREELPKNVLGKLLKNDLRKSYWKDK